jgi:hypothetical protein
MLRKQHLSIGYKQHLNIPLLSRTGSGGRQLKLLFVLPDWKDSASCEKRFIRDAIYL